MTSFGKECKLFCKSGSSDIPILNCRGFVSLKSSTSGVIIPELVKKKNMLDTWEMNITVVCLTIHKIFS